MQRAPVACTAGHLPWRTRLDAGYAASAQGRLCLQTGKLKAEPLPRERHRRRRGRLLAACLCWASAQSADALHGVHCPQVALPGNPCRRAVSEGCAAGAVQAAEGLLERCGAQGCVAARPCAEGLGLITTRAAAEGEVSGSPPARVHVCADKGLSGPRHWQVLLRVPTSACLVIDYARGASLPAADWPRLRQGLARAEPLTWDLLLVRRRPRAARTRGAARWGTGGTRSPRSAAAVRRAGAARRRWR